jgi:hypothetical protein
MEPAPKPHPWYRAEHAIKTLAMLALTVAAHARGELVAVSAFTTWGWHLLLFFMLLRWLAYWRRLDDLVWPHGLTLLCDRWLFWPVHGAVWFVFVGSTVLVALPAFAGLLDQALARGLTLGSALVGDRIVHVFVMPVIDGYRVEERAALELQVDYARSLYGDWYSLYCAVSPTLLVFGYLLGNDLHAVYGIDIPPALYWPAILGFTWAWNALAFTRLLNSRSFGAGPVTATVDARVGGSSRASGVWNVRRRVES